MALCLQGLFYCIMQYMGTTLGIYMYRDVLGALSMMGLMTVFSMGLSFIFLALVPKVVAKAGLEKLCAPVSLSALSCMLSYSSFPIIFSCIWQCPLLPVVSAESRC